MAHAHASFGAHEDDYAPVITRSPLPENTQWQPFMLQFAELADIYARVINRRSQGGAPDQVQVNAAASSFVRAQNACKNILTSWHGAIEVSRLAPLPATTGGTIGSVLTTGAESANLKTAVCDALAHHGSPQDCPLQATLLSTSSVPRPTSLPLPEIGDATEQMTSEQKPVVLPLTNLLWPGCRCTQAQARVTIRVLAKLLVRSRTPLDLAVPCCGQCLVRLAQLTMQSDLARMLLDFCDHVKHNNPDLRPSYRIRMLAEAGHAASQRHHQLRAGELNSDDDVLPRFFMLDGDPTSRDPLLLMETST